MCDPWLQRQALEAAATWHSTRGSPTPSAMASPGLPLPPPATSPAATSPFLLNFFSPSTWQDPHSQDLSRFHPPSFVAEPPATSTSLPFSRWSNQQQSPLSSFSPFPSLPSHSPLPSSLPRGTRSEDLPLFFSDSPDRRTSAISGPSRKATKRGRHVASGERSDPSCDSRDFPSLPSSSLANENLTRGTSLGGGGAPPNRPLPPVSGKFPGLGRKSHADPSFAETGRDSATWQNGNGGNVGSRGSPSSATSELTDGSERSSRGGRGGGGRGGGGVMGADVASTATGSNPKSTAGKGSGKGDTWQQERGTEEVTLPPPCCTRMCIYFSLPCAKRQRRAMAANCHVASFPAAVTDVTSLPYVKFTEKEEKLERETEEEEEERRTTGNVTRVTRSCLPTTVKKEKELSPVCHFVDRWRVESGRCTETATSADAVNDTEFLSLARERENVMSLARERENIMSLARERENLFFARERENLSLARERENLSFVRVRENLSECGRESGKRQVAVVKEEREGFWKLPVKENDFFWGSKIGSSNFAGSQKFENGASLDLDLRL